MGRVVLKDAFVEVNGVDLSNQFQQIAINSEKDVHDVTGFQAKMKQKALGLGDGNITGTLWQDFSPGSVDATLWPLHQQDTEFDVIVREKPGAADEYHAKCVLPAYSPFSGQVGDPVSLEITFENSGQDGIVKRANSGSGSGS